MSGRTEKKRRAEVAEALPVCPHCGMEPLSFSMRELGVGRFVVAVFFCANMECRKTLSMNVIGVVQRPRTGLVLPS